MHIGFLLGLQGMRGILVTFVPLVSIEFLRTLRVCIISKTNNFNNFFVFIWSIVLSVSSFIGTRMPISTGTETTRNIRHGFEKLISEVFPSIVSILNLGNNLFHDVIVYLLLVTSFVELVIIIRKYFSRREILSYEYGF